MIELSDLIRELRQQLATAAQEQEGQAVQFDLGPVEIEVTVTVTRESSARGGIRLWVVDAEAEDGAQPRSGTQRITLTLQPRAEVSGRPARISAGDIERIPVAGHTSPGPENDPDDDWPQQER
ncbi:hypothetical protein BN159_0258 [Streptomyces davaonensis JCM 4913]|uniref:Trypsin-co-occurring domain-containing protein n=1 Tax=Streptomyces davaonensis (strain DSM 101723 / JCM 4913 / KCC S-0913 / 768) TaxID=1214101 RepID=K4QUS0_STRDJ|nr:trypco2 family protein [Streptomyces davaonensis]CCK24637.1 hypothetical protein BN159_0258 [Streptomyces davaonensis JCM 4913]